MIVYFVYESEHTVGAGIYMLAEGFIVASFDVRLIAPSSISIYL